VTAAAALPMKRTVQGRRQAGIERVTGLGFALPAILLLLLVIVAPLAVLVVLSFTDYQLGDLTMRWIGLRNFSHAAGDPVFLRSLWNTILYVVIVIPGAVALSLLVAVLVHRRRRTRGLYEIIYFLPVTSTFIAMATVWQFLLHPSLGPVNGVLKWLGLGAVHFLSDPALALPTLAVIGIWHVLGFNMILFLAGLSTIPQELYEAAELDGVRTGIDRFLTITWPLLRPTTIFVIVTTSISSFKVFDTVAVLTHGGPLQSTNVLLYQTYLEGFQYFNIGYAAALTIVFLVIIVSLSVFQNFVLDRNRSAS
jgi:multiple sugar transport system permease protein